MALPKLNDAPKYDLVIPSTKQKVRFRPYLVKEEKILLMAQESGNDREMMNAMMDTLMACIEDNINQRDLTTFDVEYMFVKLRAKSVGETAELNIKCENEECNHSTLQTINIDAIEVDESNLPESNIIEISEGIQLEMKWPNFVETMDAAMKDKTMAGLMFTTIRTSIKAILTEDERIETKDVSVKEIDEFIESMTRDQLQMIQSYIEGMPTLREEIEFICESCGHENKVPVEGMNSFM
jgi:hypothetical protein